MPRTPSFRATMSSSDELMWAIERDPILRSTITAVALLDRPPDWAELNSRIAAATRAIPRLRQRVASPPWHLGPPRWVDVPDLDLRYHLRRVVAPKPADLGTVLQLASTFAMSGFDRARPLWEFTVVEGLGGGQAALIQKIHHSLTDGVGGVRLALELLDQERRPRPGAPPRSKGDDLPDSEGSPTSWDLARRAIFDRGADLLAIAHTMPSSAGAALGGVLRSPPGTTRQAARLIRSAAKLLAPISSPLSPAMRGRGLSLAYTGFDLPWADMRAAAAAVDGTVNDVYLAAVTGGLHRYHLAHGFEVDRLRMTLPISLRTDDDPLGGNRFVPARFEVPIDIADPVSRAQAIGALVRAWRAEPALAHVDALAGILVQLPVGVVTRIFGGMLKNVDFAATNVPGIPSEVYLAGARITREYAFAPPSGASVNIALMSHGELGCVGIAADTVAIPDIAVFADALRAGFDEMLALVSPDAHPARAS